MMSSRKDWTLAVSVGFAVVTDGEKLDELRNAGITEIELSSGDFRPFFEYDYTLYYIQLQHHNPSELMEYPKHLS